jgi:hypothetical protein
MVAEIGSRGAGRTLFDVTREKMRTWHMAYRTEQSYLQWIRRYVVFHDRRHPRELGPAAAEQFLSYLAVTRKVGTSTTHIVFEPRDLIARLAALEKEGGGKPPGVRAHVHPRPGQSPGQQPRVNFA